jgi:hypothetical protein
MSRARDQYFRRAVSRTFDKVKDSAVFLTIFTNAYARDPAALMQLGMAVVLDKPLLLLVEEGTPIPENIKRMARAIETYRSMDDLEFATKKLLQTAQDLGLTGDLEA